MRRLLLIVALLSTLACSAVTYSGTLPVMFITTENNQAITSKETYVNATYYLDPMGVEGVEAIGSASAQLGMQIRGRGNYSWTGFDKKPYRIKLDQKQPLLGMASSRHFALLAHADDNYGFMRNIVGFQLSRLIGMPWTPADEPVEVVLNGDYIGLYFLTETIRVDKNRVNIVEQPDLATGSEEITGGWLVEIDNYDTDPHVSIYEKDSDNSRIVFTYKTPEELSQQQKDYLLEQVNAINDALYIADTDNNSWEDFIDTDILARYYIVQEVVDDYESFHGSCYMYKNIGDVKWMFGPVWDFGSAFNYDKTQYIYKGRQWHNTWIRQMCRHPHFMDIVKQVWSDFYHGPFTEIYSYVEKYAERISAAAVADARRWPKYDNSDMASKVAYVKQRLSQGEAWLNAQWLPKDSYRFGFIDNGANPWTQVYAYMWFVADNQVTQVLGNWPGTPINYNPESGMWDYEFTWPGLPANAEIIFGNGLAKNDNQTADLPFVNGATYNRQGVVSQGVDDVAKTSLSIKVMVHRLVVDSAAPAVLTIVDIAGRVTNVAIEAGTTVIDSLSPGFYIVNGQKVLI